MDLGIAGRRAIVTGGSRGIGLAVATRLVREGVHCTIVARDRHRLESVAAELLARFGVTVHTVAIDLALPDSAERVVSRAVEKMGGIDILVNNAARASGGELEDLSHVTDQRITEDFLEKYLGYLRMARSCAPHMQSGGWGRMVHISGLAARYAGSLSAGARNIAVTHLSSSLAVELGKHGITSNVVYPGMTDTDQLALRLKVRAERGGPAPEEAIRQVSSQTAIGRLVRADEIAEFVVFVCSELASGITGEAIAVSGGFGKRVSY